MKKYFIAFFIHLLLFSYASAQETDPRQKAFQDSLTNYMLPDSLEIVPQAINTDGWLLLDESIKSELSGAVASLYNFKFDRAEKQFRSLRRRYPKHPLPYFLMGLSQWWKIMPSNITTTQYDDDFLAYMDTTITFGEALLDKNKKNYEAAFFLAAANGFAARLHSERSNWRKATVYSRRSLNNLQLAKEANGLSPEFLFGEGLYNYYAIWIAQNYPLLRPIILFFPNGNKQLGLQQLKQAANYGFYTGTESKFFLMRILANDENDTFGAYDLAQHLTTTYPDNAYFQRSYARMAFTVGNLTEAERTSLSILTKLNQRLPGYEPISGRYAAYYLGYIYQGRKDLTKAKNYYNQCVTFARQVNETKSGYAVHAYLNLARISHQEKDIKQAKAYYETVKDVAGKDKAAAKEAKEYLKKYRKV